MAVGCFFASLYPTAEFLLIVRGYEMWAVFQLEKQKSPETLERNATVDSANLTLLVTKIQQHHILVSLQRL